MSAAFLERGRVMGMSVTLKEVLIEFAPLFGLSFSIFALKGFRLSHATKWRGGFWTHLLDIILSSMVGAFLIVSFCVIVMSMTPQLDAVAIIGLAVFLSVGGVSLVDGIVHKYFGIHIIDVKTPARGVLRGRVEDKDE